MDATTAMIRINTIALTAIIVMRSPVSMGGDGGGGLCGAGTRGGNGGGGEGLSVSHVSIVNNAVALLHTEFSMTHQS